MLKTFLLHMYHKIEENKIIHKIGDFLEKSSHNYKLTNTLRIHLQKKDKTFSDKTEYFYLTYVWKIEDYIG